MDIETGAISAVLRSEDTTALADAIGHGLETGLFDRGRKVWQFILDYNTDHGALPTVGVVEKKFPDFTIPDEKPGEVTFYVDELRKRRLHNRQTESMKEAAKALKEKDPRKALAIFERMVASSQDDARPSKDINIARTTDVRRQSYQARKGQKGLLGIATPWETLTEWTQGWQGGQFIVVAARTGTGKTWILDKIAAALHLQGLVPFIDSEEMSVREMAQRIDAIRARIPHSGLRAAELDDVQEAEYFRALDEFEDQPDFWISGDDASQGVTGLGAKIDRYKPAMVLIDGLYLMTDDKGGDGWEGVKNISNALKKLSRKKDIPILVTTQLNRSKGTRSNSGSDAVAYGDAIAQDADVLIFLYQDEDMRMNNEMRVRLVKQRDGTSGEFMISWDMATMDFSELDDDYNEDDEDADDVSEIPF